MIKIFGISKNEVNFTKELLTEFKKIVSIKSPEEYTRCLYYDFIKEEKIKEMVKSLREIEILDRDEWKDKSKLIIKCNNENFKKLKKMIQLENQKIESITISLMNSVD